MSIGRILDGVLATFIIGFVLVIVLGFMALLLGGIALFLPVMFLGVALFLLVMFLWFGAIEVWEWVRSRFH